MHKINYGENNSVNVYFICLHINFIFWNRKYFTGNFFFFQVIYSGFQPLGVFILVFVECILGGLVGGQLGFSPLSANESLLLWITKSNHFLRGQIELGLKLIECVMAWRLRRQGGKNRSRVASHSFGYPLGRCLGQGPLFCRSLCFFLLYKCIILFCWLSFAWPFFLDTLTLLIEDLLLQFFQNWHRFNWRHFWPKKKFRPIQAFEIKKSTYLLHLRVLSSDKSTSDSKWYVFPS